jgi:hypothetical protein
VRRHRESGDGIDLICGGEVIEPEFTAPPFGPGAWEEAGDDGVLITDRTCDELLSAQRRRAAQIP